MGWLEMNKRRYWIKIWTHRVVFESRQNEFCKIRSVRQNTNTNRFPNKGNSCVKEINVSCQLEDSGTSIAF